MSAVPVSEDESAWRLLSSTSQAAASVEVRHCNRGVGMQWHCRACLVGFNVNGAFTVHFLHPQGMYIAAMSGPVAAQSNMIKELVYSCDSASLLKQLSGLPFADVTVVSMHIHVPRRFAGSRHKLRMNEIDSPCCLLTQPFLFRPGTRHGRGALIWRQLCPRCSCGQLLSSFRTSPTCTM